MTIHALDIPESPREIAAWLEASLAGPQLLELVAELRAITNDDQPAMPSLDSILGEHRAQVLANGLAVLPADRLRKLLTTPNVLLELQELIFAEGEDYWLALIHDAELDAAAHAAWPKVYRAVVVSPRRPLRRGFLISLAALATAAVILFAIFQQPSPQPTIAWGWAKPGALEGELDRDAYLHRLAQGAEEWFRKTPQSKPELQQRIAEFRAGCQQLLAAEHRPLTPADRDWLFERCQKWLAVFVQNEADLADERKAMSEVQESMNTTVRNLVRALNERADLAS